MREQELREGDIVLCTVKKIEGATVFLHIEGGGEGTLLAPEIAAGRIRNMREYVAPNKKIVCKILRVIDKYHVYLSLRRVTAKEREEVEEKYKKEKAFLSILKTAVKEPENILKKIKENYDMADFLEEARENPKIIEKFLSESEAEAVSKLFSEKKEKEKEIRKAISLKTSSEKGIDDIKDILNVDNVQIKYLGSSQFMLSAKAKNFKQAERIISDAIEQIKAKAKSKKAEFEVVEK